MYPAVMYDNYFAIGDSEYTPFEQPEYMGIYNCEILFQNKPCYIDHRITPDGQLDWEYTEYQKRPLSSIAIEGLRHYYGNECVKVGDGLIWKKKSKRIFTDFIDNWLALKQEQDKLKGTDQYQPVLRELAKLMLNLYRILIAAKLDRILYKYINRTYKWNGVTQSIYYKINIF